MSPSIASLLIAGENDVIEFDANSLQGSWTEEQYLRLSATTNRLIEFADGQIEVLPVPTDEHQALLKWLVVALIAFVEPRGVVQFAPLRFRLPGGRFREPDLLLLLDALDQRRGNDAWRGADLVVEVISPSDRELDTVTKRREYADAGVKEYWLVDPALKTVSVLALVGSTYVEVGVYGRGSRAMSNLLSGFSLDVEALFASTQRTEE